MFHKLEQVEQRYSEVGNYLSDPKVISNQSEFQKLSKEYLCFGGGIFLFSSARVRAEINPFQV